jgi:predicted alpha-1,6-mannanase (GH76 family)
VVTSWQERAQAARSVLVAEYWDDRTGLFRTATGRRACLRWRLQLASWHYWWQAHALQALLDGVEAGDAGAAQRVPLLLAGIDRRTPGGLAANQYIDDLAWLGLATLRAHQLGLVDAAVPLRLCAAVRAGHDPDLGGFRWRIGDDFHNVPATAPAAMLLVGTSELAGDPSRLELARRTADWLHEHVVAPDGTVRDGARPRDGVLVPEGRLWSYNVGTVAGLDVLLASRADAAGADALLARAAQVIRGGTAALRTGTIWRDEHGDGHGPDPQLFRGILARFVCELVLADPGRTRDIGTDLLTQAEAAWRARDGRGRISSGWAGPGPRTPSLAAHLSGVLALGAAARLARAGLARSPETP